MSFAAFIIAYLYPGLLFAEMSRMGGGNAVTYIATLVLWPVAVPVVCAIWHRKNGGK